MTCPHGIRSQSPGRTATGSPTLDLVVYVATTQVDVIRPRSLWRCGAHQPLVLGGFGFISATFGSWAYAGFTTAVLSAYGLAGTRHGSGG